MLGENGELGVIGALESVMALGVSAGPSDAGLRLERPTPGEGGNARDGGGATARGWLATRAGFVTCSCCVLASPGCAASLSLTL